MTTDLVLSIVAAPIRVQVEENLRAAITEDRSLPADHLSGRELSERLDVSRTMTRAAVRRLEAEGLKTSIPHRGQLISMPSSDEAAQIYAVRGVLEAPAGKGIAENAAPDEIAQLRAAYKELVAARDPEEAWAAWLDHVNKAGAVAIAPFASGIGAAPWRSQ